MFQDNLLVPKNKDKTADIQTSMEFVLTKLFVDSRIITDTIDQLIKNQNYELQILRSAIKTIIEANRMHIGKPVQDDINFPNQEFAYPYNLIEKSLLFRQHHRHTHPLVFYL